MSGTVNEPHHNPFPVDSAYACLSDSEYESVSKSRKVWFDAHHYYSESYLHRLLDDYMGNGILHRIAPSVRIASIIDRLMDDGGAEYHHSLAKNPYLTQHQFERLYALDDTELLISMCQNRQCPKDIIDKLEQHENYAVYQAATVNKYYYDSPLAQYLGEDILEHPVDILNSMDVNFQSVAHIDNAKDLCKAVLGTAHPLEVVIVDSNAYTARSAGLSLLSTLQLLFMNPVKCKVDRHNYLAFLKRLMAVACPTWMHRLTVDDVKGFMAVMGERTLHLLILANNHNSARDMVRMVAHLHADDMEDGTQRNTKAIRTWCKRHNDIGTKFHDYLARKERRHEQKKLVEQDFPQAILAEYACDWPHETFGLFIPQNAKELISLGALQSHCVGGRHYAALLMHEATLIFALAPRQKDGALNLRKGYTFEYSNTGELKQSAGFANTDVAEELDKLSSDAYYYLKTCRLNMLNNIISSQSSSDRHAS